MQPTLVPEPDFDNQIRGADRAPSSWLPPHAQLEGLPQPAAGV